MASLFASFTSSPTINISFTGQETRAKKAFKAPNATEISSELLLYNGNEAVGGKVEIVVPPGKKYEHLGIKVEMIRVIDLFFDKSNSSPFTHQVRELEVPGQLTQNKSYTFDFGTEKPYETYCGLNVRLRYFVRVTISRNYGANFVKEQEFAVQNYQTIAAQAIAQEQPPQPIKMEVGIEDCLHIEFEFDRSKYQLKDVILGKIFFLLVRIKIKHMELAIIRREAAGIGSNTFNESENIVKFELMDGAPIKGESIPIRLFLSALDLTPTYRSVNNVFSVKYYLNLVLIDEEDRRYFKQQEVVFWRKQEDVFSENNQDAVKSPTTRML